MIGYITGLRALLAAQVGLRTTGNNTANAATPGYSRQRVLFVPTPSIESGPRLRVGTGVEAAAIERVADGLLDGRIRSQERALGRFDVMSLAYSEVESSFQEPSEAGLGARISGFFTSITALTTSPQDTQRRAALINEGTSVSARFHLLASQLGEFGSNVANQVQNKVLEVNRLAESISRLNRQVVEETAQGGAANEVRDERARLLKELNRIVDADALEQQDGSVTVLLSGQILVSRTRFREVDFTRIDATEYRISFADSGRDIQIRDGELAGLLDFSQNVLPDIRDRLDDVAQQLVLEFNRIHSTGIPRSGGFRSLESSYPVRTAVGNPALVPLSEAGLPFEMTAGELRVSITNEDTGRVTQETISVDPETTSLSNLAEMLSNVDHLSATIDGEGFLRVRADAGYTFDFSPRLDPDPDDLGSFGSSRATIAGSAGGPFALADGDELALTVDGGSPQTVTFSTGDFVDIGAATADEIVAAIESQTTGVRASVVAGRVVLQSETDGASGSIGAGNATGDPLGAIGLPSGTDTGADTGVEVAASGFYTGEGSRNLRLVASTSGEIGITEGLTVDVYDESGTLLRSLDVGDGYVAGEPISVVDGIEVSFGDGAISADAGDLFEIRAIADSDTGDLLAGLGLNAFFTGSNATDIEVARRIQDDASLIAGGLSGAPGDNRNFLELLALQDVEIEGLGNETLEGSYGSLVADIGSDGLRSLSFYESQTALTQFLEQQRDSISGVSLDEETVNLLQYQRQFEAASRYIAVVDATLVEVLSLVR